MTEQSPHATDPDLTGTILDFTPVPLERNRASGWSVLSQRRFIYALSVMGSVGAAARAVGMGRVSAYRLRERALNGVTTIRVLRGGSVSVAGGPDMSLVRVAMRDNPAPCGGA